ncbi:hypothetical protein DF153_16490 [Burkholderia cenocepacia]|nr:hypothetical protein DF152_30795 [Burkholderia cenocepacia]RQU24036.1 hypothetical protein DF153_16490 [Burkholderia cenocepacia]
MLVLTSNRLEFAPDPVQPSGPSAPCRSDDARSKIAPRRRKYRALIAPHISSLHRPSPRDFFLSGGVTRTSSSARISPDPPRSVPSPPELRRTPAQQGCAAFVTASATSGGTR